MTPAQQRIRQWADNANLFVREVLGATPDKWQDEVLQSVRERRIALLACKNPGKTCVLAWIAWHFLLTRPHPKVIATSISGDNLADGLWAEMAKWQNQSELLKRAFKWNQTSIRAIGHEETWFMVARQWSKSANTEQQANTLAGKHADYMLFILDEVGGIPDSVMVAAEAALGSGIETKILIAGNPTHLSGPLYRAATTDRELWKLFRITGDPDAPNRAPRVSIEWAREQIKQYGRTSAWIMVNVLGEFPPSSLNSLLGPDEVMAAMNRHINKTDYEFAEKRLGVDVARFGDDSTVIAPRQGLVAFKMVKMRDARTQEIAARIIKAKNYWESDVEFIDDTGGWGAGVIDSMLQGGYAPHSVNFSGKAIDPRYMNKRAEMWFEMAEWIRRGGAIPNDPQLQKELTAPTYTFMNGKFQLEPKDQIKARLGFSPDCFVAGTLVLTPNGNRPIEEIMDGDLVSTPMGARRVIKTWASQTDKITTVMFSNGKTLSGKGKHRVFTWDSGWIRLDALTPTNNVESDYLLRRCHWLILRKLFTRANHFGFKAAADIINPGTRIKARDFFIVKFGFKRMGQSLAATMFTTLMEIGRIIHSTIWRYLKPQSIPEFIPLRQCPNQTFVSDVWPAWKRPEPQPRPGTKAPQGFFGTLSMQKNSGVKTEESQSQLNAYSAAKKENLFSQVGQGSVQGTAKGTHLIAGIRRLLANASCVAKNSFLTNIGLKSVVPVSVQTDLGDCDKKVYNLTLESENVYYANGILVDNCADALALTFALPDRAKGFSHPLIKNKNSMLSEYDPFDEKRW